MIYQIVNCIKLSKVPCRRPGPTTRPTVRVLMVVRKNREFDGFSGVSRKIPKYPQTTHTSCVDAGFFGGNFAETSEDL